MEIPERSGLLKRCFPVIIPVIVYLLVSALRIIFSDTLVARMIDNSESTAAVLNGSPAGFLRYRKGCMG